MNAAAVPSPCIAVCRMDSGRGVCEGCLRTLGEIAEWATMSDADKRSVLALLPLRRRAEAGRPRGSGPHSQGAAE